MSLPRWILPGALALAVASAPAGSATTGSTHGPDMLPVLEALVLMLLGARLGGSLAERFDQPAVLGELAAGIVIGNLGLAGYHALDGLRDLDAIQVLAQVGVLFLLFRVGLETDVGQMMAVGASSLLVATLGVVAPMLLGLGVSRWFFPAHHPLTHWFVGATLCATSVGITARVLADLKRTASTEGRIILGAAVIDDVMGLIVLAVVSGVISAADHGQAFEPASILWILGKSLLFLAGALVIGRWLSPRVFRLAARLRGDHLLLPVALAICFGLAWIAGRTGLAPIVGAFAGGLILEEPHYRQLVERDRERRKIPQLLEPLETFLVPLFFVLMGMHVDLRVFGSAAILGFASVLTLVAVIGKQACALGVLEKGADRLAVGLGMIPRGEVGLIFASIGATLHIGGERVVDDTVFSAVVVMVAVTTLLTPPLLVWRLRGAAVSGRQRKESIMQTKSIIAPVAVLLLGLAAGSVGAQTQVPAGKPVTVGGNIKKPRARPAAQAPDSTMWSATTYEAATTAEHRKVLASGKRTRLTGEVVDVSCYLQLGKHGAGHEACAAKCANNGQPIGLLTSSQGLYLLFPEEHHPRRDGQAEIRTRLIPLMGKTVTLQGTTTMVRGSHGLFLRAADLDSLAAPR